MSFEAILLVVFAGGCFGVLYAYVVFPAFAALLTARRLPEASAPDQSDVRPTVTVIIPAFNEERSLAAKIRNVLATDYPRDRLEVIVVSDASTDRTNDIARSFAHDGVSVLVQETRQGKSAGLNRAMAQTRGEIVVFTDANAAYTPRTIPTLIGRFRRPEIGLVTGFTHYVAPDNTEVAGATNSYTSLERVIKTAESRWGCCVGADGAIFAMRRSLFQPLRHDDINDLVLPLSVIEQGFQCVFADDVFCSEPPGASVSSEYRRQSRITNRTLRALWRHAQLLNPVRFGVFSFFLFSHKVARMLVPLFLLVAFASLAMLAGTHVGYLIVAATACLWLALAVVASRVPSPSWSLPGRLLRLVGVFVTINAAVLEGWWNFLRGRRDVVWQHDRSGG